MYETDQWDGSRRRLARAAVPRRSPSRGDPNWNFPVREMNPVDSRNRKGFQDLTISLISLTLCSQENLACLT